jgi:hypothetical protein
VTTSTAVSVGVLIGLLLASVVTLLTLMHYVSQDMDKFLRWLDHREAA